MKARVKLENQPEPIQKRVAVYCRQSVADDLEFSSIEAQSQAIRAYIESQRGEGWTVLPEDYVDRGFSGGNMDRPAFQELLRDIEKGNVDIVAVYKIDRISRSLRDFTKIIEFFEEHEVSFVAITQQFNTASAMGQLTMNVLMSFSEFERKIISERTKDKLHAMRKRGQWVGGRPPLGYDLVEKKLLVNEEEADRVRVIYGLYLELHSYLAVVAELNQRGWKTKTHTTKQGKVLRGKPYDKLIVRRILTNSVYIGMVTSKNQQYEGNHEPIIDMETWDAVQRLRQKHQNGSGTTKRKKHDALLGGLLRCGVCGKGFSHHYASRGDTRYFYYTCETYVMKGASACPKGRIPANQLDRFVVDRIRAIGNELELLEKTASAIKKELEQRIQDLQGTLDELERDKQRLNRERTGILDNLSKGGTGTQPLIQRLGDIDTGLQRIDAEVADTQQSLESSKSHHPDAKELQRILSAFDPVWNELFTKEKARILNLLIDHITLNAQADEIEIIFRAGGFTTLAAEIEEDAA